MKRYKKHEQHLGFYANSKEETQSFLNAPATQQSSRRLISRSVEFIVWLNLARRMDRIHLFGQERHWSWGRRNDNRFFLLLLFGFRFARLGFLGAAVRGTRFNVRVFLVIDWLFDF